MIISLWIILFSRLCSSSALELAVVLHFVLKVFLLIAITVPMFLLKIWQCIVKHFEETGQYARVESAMETVFIKY